MSHASHPVPTGTTSAPKPAAAPLQNLAPTVVHLSPVKPVTPYKPWAEKSEHERLNMWREAFGIRPLRPDEL